MWTMLPTTRMLFPQSRGSPLWLRPMKRESLMLASGRSSHLPQTIRPAFALRSHYGTHSATPGVASQAAPKSVPAREAPIDKGHCPQRSSEATEGQNTRAERAKADADEEEAEEESYVPATGQGCYSFEMSLLQRAAQTFAKRSVADKYMQVARWLQLAWLRPSRGKAGIFCPSIARALSLPLPCLGCTSQEGTFPLKKQTERNPMLLPKCKVKGNEIGYDMLTGSLGLVILQGLLNFETRGRQGQKLPSFAQLIAQYRCPVQKRFPWQQ